MTAGLSSLAYAAVGLGAGVFAGLFGLGGGLVLIPALIWIFHLSQHQAQGLSLTALLLPVGILGAWTYYRQEPFPLKPALFLALGLLAGTYLGASGAQLLSGRVLRTAFAVLMILAGVKLLFTRP